MFVVATAPSIRPTGSRGFQATAVASLVGGLADWFAVTALLPPAARPALPHTRDRGGAQRPLRRDARLLCPGSFLTPSAVSDRLRSAHAVETRWPGGSATPTTPPSSPAAPPGALSAGADLLRDEDVQDVLNTLVRQRVDQVALAPLVGRALGELTREGRHEPIVDAALDGFRGYLAEHGEELHHRLGVTPRGGCPVPRQPAGGPADRPHRSGADRYAQRSPPPPAPAAGGRPREVGPGPADLRGAAGPG